MEVFIFPCFQQNPILNKPRIAISVASISSHSRRHFMQNFHVSLTINNDEHFCELSEKRLSNRNSSLLLCSCSLSSSSVETAKAPTISLQHEGRRALISSILTAGSFLSSYLCTLGIFVLSYLKCSPSN